jgi:hypothetical protein
MGNAGAAMRLVAVRRWQQGRFHFFSSLSPYSSFPCSRPRHGDKEGKSKWQGKETQRSARAYIAKMGRRTGESKETTKSHAFNAKTVETTMITLFFR